MIHNYKQICFISSAQVYVNFCTQLSIFTSQASNQSTWKSLFTKEIIVNDNIMSQIRILQSKYRISVTW